MKTLWLLVHFLLQGTSAAGPPEACPSLLAVASSRTKGDVESEHSQPAGLGPIPQSVEDILCPHASYQRTLKESAQRMVLEVTPEPGPAQRAKFQELQERVRNARRCAVVSNSGALLKHHHGAAIDSSDLVFRFNDAEFGGEFADAVGSRDDLRLVNHKAVVPLTEGVSDVSRKNMTVWLLTRLNPGAPASLDLVRGVADKSKLVRCAFAVNTAILEHVARNLLVDQFGTTLQKKMELKEYGILTTGYKGVVLAMTLCDEVRAYGFPATPDSDTSPFHYYGELKHGNASVNEDSVHSFTAENEKQLYRRLALNDDIDATDVAVIPGFSRLECSGGTTFSR